MDMTLLLVPLLWGKIRVIEDIVEASILFHGDRHPWQHCMDHHISKQLYLLHNQIGTNKKYRDYSAFIK